MTEANPSPQSVAHCLVTNVPTARPQDRAGPTGIRTLRSAAGRSPPLFRMDCTLLIYLATATTLLASC